MVFIGGFLSKRGTFFKLEEKEKIPWAMKGMAIFWKFYKCWLPCQVRVFRSVLTAVFVFSFQPPTNTKISSLLVQNS